MDKTNLVYVKGGDGFVDGVDEFKPNKLYRSIKVSENEWLVNGCSFDDDTFKEHFQFAYERIMHHWSDMGLLNGDKPVSKKEFKELAGIHEYGFAGGLKRSGRARRWRISTIRRSPTARSSASKGRTWM